MTTRRADFSETLEPRIHQRSAHPAPPDLRGKIDMEMRRPARVVEFAYGVHALEGFAPLSNGDALAT